jgi:hypothetical protein
MGTSSFFLFVLLVISPGTSSFLLLFLFYDKILNKDGEAGSDPKPNPNLNSTVVPNPNPNPSGILSREYKANGSGLG